MSVVSYEQHRVERSHTPTFADHSLQTSVAALFQPSSAADKWSHYFAACLTFNFAIHWDAKENGNTLMRVGRIVQGSETLVRGSATYSRVFLFRLYHSTFIYLAPQDVTNIVGYKMLIPTTCTQLQSPTVSPYKLATSMIFEW